MLRTLAERLSRWKVIKRRLPSRCGGRRIFVSPDSALQYLKPDLDSPNRELFDVVCSHVHPGDSVWDIGANVGILAFAAAHLVGANGEVLALEADPFLASLLQRSAQLPTNRDLNVSVLCAAAADKPSIARFLIASRGRSSNSLEQSGHRTQAGGTRYVQYVPTITLDDLLSVFRSPNFIKMDVEGAEEFVLQGAHQILTNSRPRFYIEVGPSQSEAVTAIFRQYNYKLYHGGSDGDGDSDELEQCSFNTLAVPG